MNEADGQPELEEKLCVKYNWVPHFENSAAIYQILWDKFIFNATDMQI